MGRRFITARDIDDLLARGEQDLVVDASTVLTDLAREHARDRGVRVVTSEGPRVAQDVVAQDVVAEDVIVEDVVVERPPAAASRAAQDHEGPSRRQLRAAVRAAVVEEFGTTPPGVDAAIGRVFDRFGIEG